MSAKVKLIPEMNQNPVLNVENNGTIIYSNEASEPILNEWGVRAGEKLPSSIVDLVQRVTSRNSPEKMEVKVGDNLYLFVCDPLPEQECVNILGFDISYQGEAKEKQSENEEKYHKIYNLIEEGVTICELVLDEKGQPIDVIILEANPAYEKHSGLRREKVIDRPLKEVFPSLEHIWLDHCGEVIRSGTGTHFDGYNASLEKWFEVFASPMEGNRFIAVFSDITESKKAEKALRESEIKYRTLSNTLEEKVRERTDELEKAYNLLKESETSLAEAQEMANIGNWVWDIATDKAYWSNELYRIFGRDPQKLAPTIDEFHNYIHPDYRHDYVNLANKALNDKSSFCVDVRIISDDGEERRVNLQTKIVVNETNDPVQIKGIVRDITESKKAEEKIHHLANIVESSEDAIGTLTLDGTIISWNKGAEKVYGYSVDEILGKCVSILAPPHLDKETIKLIEKIKKREHVNNYDTLRLKKDGKAINISITLSPVFDTSGKLTNVSFITRDITKRKEAEEALAKIEIARKQEIHHRIKNNLQVISSLLDLQAEKFRGKEKIEVSQILEALKESQDRVISMALIHEELHKGGEIDTINFCTYIQELADNLFLSYRLGNESTSLNMYIEEDIFFDMDVAVPLGMIVNELISNSLKHAFPDTDHGEIRINLHTEEIRENKAERSRSRTFTLSISDNGIGISEDIDIDCLDSLGLQLITTLAEQLDGELELKRENGTEFIIRFAVIEKPKEESFPVVEDSEAADKTTQLTLHRFNLPE